MKKKNPNNVYFTKETEDAILEYNLTTDVETRNKIYEEKIKYAFDKMVENIIHTYKFYYFDTTYGDLKHDTLAFLNEKIHKYTDPERGKAYSYFSITAKNYLINKNRQMYESIKKHIDIDTLEEPEEFSYEEEFSSLNPDLEEFVNGYQKYIDENLNLFFTDQEEREIADSILELFRRRYDIKVFNKKAFYVLIRDRVSNTSTKNITRVVAEMKKLYIELFQAYQSTGIIKLKRIESQKVISI